ncbi:MAG: pilus assembly protein TadG-related protein [Candidatus Acidiferrales bacterium]
MKRRSEAGQALITVAYSMVVLIGFMGLAVDMGYLRHVKRQMQSAADSAAIAGAAELQYGDSTSAAKADSARNGFTDGNNGVQVTVSSPKSGQVQVVVSQDQPTFFMRIFRVTSVALSARAVGTLGSSRGPLYALGGGDAINTNGDEVDVDVPNGTITDNGNLAAGGGGSIIASSIGVAGSVSSGGTQISPTPQTGIAPISDPLSTLPKPSAGGCDKRTIVSKDTTRNPGTFCGITINGSGGGGGGEGDDDGKGSVSVHFNPGVYVLTDGITVNGSATLTGTDVTFFNSGGPIVIQGDVSNDKLILSAATTGTYAGILFFQDPSNTSSATIAGAGGSKIEGALYFPQAQLTTNGGGSAAYTIVVAKTIVFKGGNDSTFNNNFSSLPGGSPIKTAVLVE